VSCPNHPAAAANLELQFFAARAMGGGRIHSSSANPFCTGRVAAQQLAACAVEAGSASNPGALWTGCDGHGLLRSLLQRRMPSGAPLPSELAAHPRPRPQAATSSAPAAWPRSSSSPGSVSSSSRAPSPCSPSQTSSGSHRRARNPPPATRRPPPAARHPQPAERRPRAPANRARRAAADAGPRRSSDVPGGRPSPRPHASPHGSPATTPRQARSAHHARPRAAVDTRGAAAPAAQRRGGAGGRGRCV
jgi:hypothetical protein